MTGNKMVRKSLEDGIDLFGSLEFRSIGVDGSFTDVAFHIQNLIRRGILYWLLRTLMYRYSSAERV